MAETGSVPVRAERGGEVTERRDAPGYRAVAALLRYTGRSMSEVRLPPFTADQPYYPATLHLLAAMAAAEAADHCIA